MGEQQACRWRRGARLKEPDSETMGGEGQSSEKDGGGRVPALQRAGSLVGKEGTGMV